MIPSKRGLCDRVRFPLIAGTFQIVFIILFALFAKYDETTRPGGRDTTTNNQYAAFQDVHVMMFIGFGFLMTFLKRYGYTAVGINFLIAAMCLQWATLFRGFLYLDETGKFTVHLGEMLTADFSAATVLISFGACLGKTSPTQLIVMAVIEIGLAEINEMIGEIYFKASDAGESMWVHIFGAYFGLAVARVLYRKDISQVDSEGATYHSDIFAMIGTIFLWLFWPSFNGAALAGTEQNRAFVNTYLSLSACCVVSFVMSWLVHGEFNMVHIQNATLAGGVAVGTAADLLILPYGAILIGSFAAIISVLGYQFLTPVLARCLKIHDTCGVNNLHGMPGIMAALVGAIMASLANASDYGFVLFEKYPPRIPSKTSGPYYELIRRELGNNSTSVLNDLINATTPHEGRTASQQAGFQLAAMVLTLSIAIVGGIVTGLILRIPTIFDPPEEKRLFEDDMFWEIPEFHPYRHSTRRQENSVGEGSVSGQSSSQQQNVHNLQNMQNIQMSSQSTLNTVSTAQTTSHV